MWDKLNTLVNDYLNSVSLADLAENGSTMENSSIIKDDGTIENSLMIERNS